MTVENGFFDKTTVAHARTEMRYNMTLDLETLIAKCEAVRMPKKVIELKIGAFEIRALDGEEALEVAGAANLKSKTALILRKGVVSPSLSENNATTLYRKMPGVAERLIAEINSLTEEASRIEEAAEEFTEKK